MPKKKQRKRKLPSISDRDRVLALAEELNDLLDKMNIQKYVICGMSAEGQHRVINSPLTHVEVVGILEIGKAAFLKFNDVKKTSEIDASGN